MKETIEGVMSYPYLDKLVIVVGRRLDRFHVATTRMYSAYYSDEDKARKLVKSFLKMNDILQNKIIEARIESWRAGGNQS